MVTPPSAAARTVPSVIKYLGSKRLLAPLIGDAVAGARRAHAPPTCSRARRASARSCGAAA